MRIHACFACIQRPLFLDVLAQMCVACVVCKIEIHEQTNMELIAHTNSRMQKKTRMQCPSQCWKSQCVCGYFGCARFCDYGNVLVAIVSGSIFVPNIKSKVNELKTERAHAHVRQCWIASSCRMYAIHCSNTLIPMNLNVLICALIKVDQSHRIRISAHTHTHRQTCRFSILALRIKINKTINKRRLTCVRVRPVRLHQRQCFNLHIIVYVVKSTVVNRCAYNSKYIQAFSFRVNVRFS